MKALYGFICGALLGGMLIAHLGHREQIINTRYVYVERQVDVPFCSKEQVQQEAIEHIALSLQDMNVMEKRK